ncbi:unnamed protein product, partial [Effrenium voratum]
PESPGVPRRLRPQHPAEARRRDAAHALSELKRCRVGREELCRARRGHEWGLLRALWKLRLRHLPQLTGGADLDPRRAPANQ